MTDDIYRVAFKKAKLDLEQAIQKKEKAERDLAEAQGEIVHLRRTVTALAPLCGENVEDSIGLTAAVRILFETRSSWLSVRDVKQQVEALGVAVTDLKNPEASVQSVLNRLHTAGELQTGIRKPKN